MTDLSNITFEGIPLGEKLDKEERSEIREHHKEEANQYRPAIRSNRGGKAKFVGTQAEKHGRPVRYGEIETVGYLIEKAGGAMKRREFARLPRMSQDKLNRCFRIIMAVPEDFITAEVKDMLKSMGLGDWQRYLYMLFRAGFFTREKDVGKRYKHLKTDLAKGTEAEIAQRLYERRKYLDDYESKPAEQLELDEPPKVVEEPLEVVEDTAAGTEAEEAIQKPEPEKTEAVAEEESGKPPEKVDVARNGRVLAPPIFADIIETYQKVSDALPGIEMDDFLAVYLRSRRNK